MADGLYRHELRITLSIQRLADALGLGRRATFDRIHSLERTGVIINERSGGGRYENGRGRLNVWRLNLDALRNQALAKAEKLESSTENKGTESTDKGAVGCTVMSAAEQRQGCSRPTTTVQPTAQDQVSPIPQEKKTNGIARPRHPKGGGTMPRYNLNDLRPWVNQHDAPPKIRADRLTQMRMQLAHAEDKARKSPKPLVDSATEGEK